MRKLLRIGSGLWLALLPCLSVADAYLDSLQKAAGDVKVDAQTAQGGSVPEAGGPMASDRSGAMPAGMSRSEFEAFLQQKYFGSYSFFKKLDAERQERVYKTYTSRSDFEQVRQEVKQQYLSK